MKTIVFCALFVLELVSAFPYPDAIPGPYYEAYEPQQIQLPSLARSPELYQQQLYMDQRNDNIRRQNYENLLRNQGLNERLTNQILTRPSYNIQPALNTVREPYSIPLQRPVQRAQYETPLTQQYYQQPIRQYQPAQQQYKVSSTEAQTEPSASQDINNPYQQNPHQYSHYNAQNLAYHPRIQQVLASTPLQKRYLVLHPNGTIEHIDKIEHIVEQHPNYILVNAGSVAQPNGAQKPVAQSQFAPVAPVAPSAPAAPAVPSAPAAPVAPAAPSAPAVPAPSFEPAAPSASAAPAVPAAPSAPVAPVPPVAPAAPNTVAPEVPVAPVPATVNSAPGRANPAPAPTNPAPEPANSAPISANPAPPQVNPEPQPVNPVPEPVNPAPAPVNSAPAPFGLVAGPIDPAPSPVPVSGPVGQAQEPRSIQTGVVPGPKPTVSPTGPTKTPPSLTAPTAQPPVILNGTIPGSKPTVPPTGPSELPPVTAPTAQPPVFVTATATAIYPPPTTPLPTQRPTTAPTVTAEATTPSTAADTATAAVEVTTPLPSTTEDPNQAAGPSTVVPYIKPSDSKNDLDVLKVKGAEPIVWFRTKDVDFWKKLTRGDEVFDVVYFFNVPREPRVDKETKTTIHADGTVVEEITQTIYDDDESPPRTIKTTTVTKPDGTQSKT